MSDTFLLPDEELRLQAGSLARNVEPPAASNNSDFLLPGEQTASERAMPVVRSAIKVDPERAARSRSISQGTGVPEPVVERNFDQLDAEEKARTIQSLMAASPAFARQMSDAQFAKIAHDDAANLATAAGMLRRPDTVLDSQEFSEKVIEFKRNNPTADWDVARQAIKSLYTVDNATPFARTRATPVPQGPQAIPDLIGRLFAGGILGVQDALAGGARAVADFLGADRAAASAAAWSQIVEADKEAITPVFTDPTARAVYGGVASTIQQGPGILAGIATGSAAPALAYIGATTAGAAYNKYRNRGASPFMAAVGSLGEGATEVVTEFSPMGYVVNKLGKVGAREFLIGTLGRDILPEQANTVVSDAIDTAIANPNKTWAQYLKERPGAAYETLVSTVVQAGMMAAGGRAMKPILDRRVQDAEQNAEALKRLLDLSTASKVLERDPKAYADFIQEAAAEGPIENIYVPATVFAEAAGENLQVFMQAMPSVKEQMDAALVSGSDLVIPLGEFAAHVPGTGMESKLIEHARTSIDGMSQNDAKVFMQGQVEAFNKAAAEQIAKVEVTDALKESSAKVENEIFKQLEAAGRFTKDVNAAYALYASAFFTTTAARLGITPEEAFKQFGQRVNNGAATTPPTASEPKKTMLQRAKEMLGLGEKTPATVNIGLNVNDGTTITPDEARAALKAAGVKIESDAVHQSNTESTLVAKLDRPLTEKEAVAVSTALRQEAIAQHDGKAGELYGPKADAWRPFNPDYFLGLDGKPMSVLNPDEGWQVIDGVAGDLQTREQAQRIIDLRTKGNGYVKPLPSWEGREFRVRQDEGHFLIERRNKPGASFNQDEAPNPFGMTPEQQAVSIAPWIYGEYAPFTGLKTVRELGEVLQDVIPQRKEYTDENRDFLASVIVKEVELGLANRMGGPGWYSHTLDAALDIAALTYPEIKTDPDKRFAFTFALAVTSNGQTVPKNYEYAMEVYGRYVETGKMAGFYDKTKKRVVGYGVRGDNMLAAFNTFNEITKEIGVARFKEFLLTKHPVHTLNMVAGRALKEMVDQELYGGAIIGPKIGGGFLQNINGNHDALTMDVWMFRMWGRITGDILSDRINPKTGQRDMLKETTDSGEKRAFIRETFETALAQLQGRGHDLAMDDVQALLWYAEKTFYTVNGVNDEEGKGYDNAAATWAEARGITSPIVDAVLRPGLDGGRASGEQPGAAGAAQTAGGPARTFEQSRRTSRDVGLREAQAAAIQGAQGVAPLNGLPMTPLLVDGTWYVPGPVGVAHDAAAKYMADAGLPYLPNHDYAKIDRERAKRIAKAFDEMKHAPDDPEVKAAYRAMIDETLAQWQAIKATGLKVEFIKNGVDPYASTPRGAIIDVRDSNHLWVFPTDSGFGSDSTDVSGNPLLELTDEVIDGHRLRANDVFRIVHDYFGHIKDGNGFRAEGEENAWRSHSAMYSPLARRAMTTETRGQNSWVNFGPYGEANQKASAGDTHYAPQKIGLLPEWVSEEGRQDAQVEYPGPQFPVYGQRRPGAVSVVAVHYSKEARSTLDSSMYGQGAVGAERAEVMANPDERLRKRTFFYVNEGNGVAPEKNVGSIAHAVRLNNIYDATSDPLEIWHNGGEAAVLDAGFDGYYARGQGAARGTVTLLGQHNVPVVKLGFERDANAATAPFAPPAPQITSRRALVDAILNDKRLPRGQMTPAEWKTTIEKVAPDLLARIPAEAFTGTEPIYRDGLVATFYQSPFPESVVQQVVYHVVGTGVVFDSFNTEGRDLGSHFATTPAQANAVMYSDEAGHYSVPAYLNIKNPLRLVDRGGFEASHIGGQLVGAGVITEAQGEALYAENVKNPEAADKRAKAFIEAAGYDGVVYLNRREGVEPVVGEEDMTDAEFLLAAPEARDSYIAFHPEQIKSVFNKNPTSNPDFLKQGESGARGNIAFGADITQQTTTINLLKNADLSTFLHEMGHFQLEVLSHIASQPNAPAEIVDDMNKALKWFGVPDLATWNAMPLEEKRTYHEQWARGMEAYLFEGKAPNPELNGLFSRFRAWMIRVYRDLTGLNVTLTDEVRGVFDRLIATNEQILQAEQDRAYAPLFKSAEEMGATPAEWAAYQALGQEATQAGVDHLQAASLRDMAYASNARARAIKALQKEAKEKRAAVEAEVAAEVNAQPIYKARAFLTHGILDGEAVTHPGARLKLSLEDMKQMYGTEPNAPWRYFNTGANGMVAADASSGGVHPDVIAEMFGFTSGDHLVRELLAADPPRLVIQGLTDARMLERYGDLTDEQSIARAADAAVHNEVRARFIATELRALAKATGSPKIMTKAAKAFAEQIIARKKVRDIKPNAYSVAETRAAKAAQKTGNLVEKATEKRNQLVNHYAARAAYDALDEVAKIQRYLKKFDNEGTRKSIDIDHLDQIDAILERFDLRQITNKAADKRASLAAWITKQEEAGIDPVIPDEIRNEAFRKPFKEMTVEEIRGLYDSIRNIEHIGRRWKELFTAKDKREFEAVVADMSASIRENATGTVAERRSSDRGFLVAAGKLFRGFFASHRKFASLAREMDGWKDAGVMWERLVWGMNDAGNAEAVAREKATIKLGELLEPVLAAGKMGEKKYFPTSGKSFTREERIGLLLNMGNEVNRERVVSGEHLTEVALKEIFATLTPQDAAFVQAVWDYLDTFRPAIREKERRLTGVEPEWVEAAPYQVTLSDGNTVTLRGGYYPIKYDPIRSERSNADSAAEVQKQLERGLYARAQTRRGHTKARVESTGRPLRLDFGSVLASHVDQVIHDLSWHEYLIDANRLLRAPAVESAIREHYGFEKLREMKKTLTDIAVGDMAAQSDLDTVLNHLRHGATVAGLGWRVTTSLLQPLGLTQSIVRIGAGNVLRGAWHWAGDAASLENSNRIIGEKSEFMRLRAKTMQREINEIRNKVTGGDSKIEASYFYLIQKMQLVADIPTWWGEYERVMQLPDMTEEKAVALADQAVRDAQGAGQIGDLAGIQRGHAGLKLFTNFYSFFSTTYNLTRESFGRTKSIGDVPLLAADMLLLYSIPAILGTVLKAALGGDFEDPDKLKRRLIADQLNYMLGTVVLLREVGSATQAALGLTGDYGGPASVRFFGDLAKLAKQVHQMEADEGFWKALNSTAGSIFHYPAGQISATIDGLNALATGKTKNPGALLVGSNKN